MLIPKVFLVSTLGNKDVDVFDEIVDTTRWSVVHERIVRYDGKLYSAPYSEGATESQDESPYEYDADMIECEEVEPYEKTVIAYRPVSE